MDLHHDVAESPVRKEPDVMEFRPPPNGRDSRVFNLLFFFLLSKKRNREGPDFVGEKDIKEEKTKNVFD